jgi:subtilase family serine protease
MSRSTLPGKRMISLVGTAALVSSALVTASASPALASHRVTPSVGVHPHAIPASKASHPDGQVLFNCQLSPPPESVACYGPDQIRVAYGIQPLLNRGTTGKGRTIVIIDAFSPPGVADDLKLFDSTWGLPDPQLQIIAPQGATPFDINNDDQVSWSAEISLDVQWSHVVAPGAKIVLVESRSDQDSDILAATQWAVQHQVGDVISQSFGEDESCVDPKILKAEHAVFQQATAKGITLIASAGDDGSAQLTCDGSTYHLAASSPATDPLVLGIGGTHLLADQTSGAYGSESVWNESDTFGAAGGGGYSRLYSRPDYQNGFSRSHGRGVPDVAYNAAIDGGVLVNWGTVGGGFYIFGGTSSGSPQWAGLTALADQVARHRIGFVNDALYRAGSNRFAYGSLFHDVTAGDNSLTDVVDPSGNTVSVPGFPATRGWDAATGLGTPRANNLVPYLAFAG